MYLIIKFFYFKFTYLIPWTTHDQHKKEGCKHNHSIIHLLETKKHVKLKLFHAFSFFLLSNIIAWGLRIKKFSSIIH
jgi:hypothetical protein